MSERSGVCGLPLVTIQERTLVAWMRRCCTDGEARRIRIDAGARLEAVAVALDVSPTSLWRWETGRGTPRMPAALIYAIELERLGADAWGRPSAALEWPPNPRRDYARWRRMRAFLRTNAANLGWQ